MNLKGSRFAVLGAVVKIVRGGRAPGGPSLPQRVRAVPRMVRMTVTGRYRGMSTGRLAGLAVGALYIVSPVDLMPELLLPLIGLGDDMVVLTFVVSGLMAETEQFLLWERNQALRGQAGGSAPDRGSDASPGVVPGEVVESRTGPSRR